ncbi:hypothetical protein ACOMHN_044747 [Nucella lapillus]
MIEEAEMYIQRMAEQMFSSAVVDYNAEEMECSAAEAMNCEHKLEAGEDVDGQMSTSFNHDSQRNSAAECERARRTHRVSGVSVTVSSELLDQSSYMKRSGILPTYLQRPESLLYILYEEFIRHDVVALLAISMSSTFALLCFQMMIVPVMQRFLGGDELYPFFLFCLALVLLLTTCGGVWGCGEQRRALYVLVAGACVVILGIVLFMVFLHCMTQNKESKEDNMIWISVCVGLYVIGLPLLLIPATSVFTMLSDHTHHGLRQGVYHSALSVSAILAPLWVEGTTTRLFLHHGVIVGLLLASLVAVCCSGRHISALQAPAPVFRRRGGVRRHHRSAPTRPITTGSSEHQPLLA